LAFLIKLMRRPFSVGVQTTTTIRPASRPIVI